MKAYRKLAQQWHPDNFANDDEKKKAEAKFIDIASAKEVLTDPGGYFVLTSSRRNETLSIHFPRSLM